PGGASNTKLGTIYKIDRSTNPNTVAPFFTTNAGTDVHDYSSSDLGTPTGDTAAGNQAAKAGWADIDLSSDGKTLYAINLSDKKIYAIPVSGLGSSLAAGTATPISFPSSVTSGLCSNNEWVPGGVKTYRNEVYVTVTCTAETSQLTADLKFFVYKFPQGASSPFTQVVSMPAPARENGSFNQQWRAWTTTVTLDGTAGATTDPNRYIYPQPWAMDIEFDEFGKLYLGIRNRSSDMRAAFNDADQPSYEYGDTQVGLPNADGTYTMLASVQPAPYEFIDDLTTTGGEHPENDMGALAVVAGTKEIITPATIGNSIQGIRSYATVDATTTIAKSGIPLRYYGLTQGTNVAAAGNPFGKVAGLGDLEILAAPAPIEVGDRVWVDTDKDGIQDADEPGLAGVSVSLACGADTASAVTNTSGQFIFVNTSGGNASFMQAEEDCSLSIDKTQAALKAYQLTTTNADGDSSNNALTDLRDSDAVGKATTDEITFKAGNAGENNHSLDFGYSELPVTDLALAKLVTPTQPKHGEQAVYTLTVTNQSTTTDATNVKIADQLPAGLSYVSDDGLAQYGSDVFDEATGSWTVGIVTAGSSKSLKITVQVP
ncbi:MAG TPA: SdrD B-like domain-containing protein, partial [Thiolinea sp.]|nr:SdrD B-like domain-containing protein [Thiolinea sp.]